MPRGARHAFLRLILLGLACRAVVPAGFMPASPDQGGPVRICHGGPAAELVFALAAVRHGAAADTGQHASSHGTHPTAVRAGAHEPPAAHSADEPAAPHRVHEPNAQAGTDNPDTHHGTHEPDAHHGTHEPDAQHGTWEHCPSGAAFAFAALTGVVAFEFLAFDHVLYRNEQLPALRSDYVHTWQARAPPIV